MNRTQATARPRRLYLAFALACIALGLATRPLKQVADALGSALGDALYAALVYLLLAVLFPRLRPLFLFLLATALCWGIELSQKWHSPALDAVRHTTLGALALGGTFSFGDLGCYAIGTGCIFLWETLARLPTKPRQHTSP